MSQTGAVHAGLAGSPHCQAHETHTSDSSVLWWRQLGGTWPKLAAGLTVMGTAVYIIPTEGKLEQPFSE